MDGGARLNKMRKLHELNERKRGCMGIDHLKIANKFSAGLSSDSDDSLEYTSENMPECASDRTTSESDFYRPVPVARCADSHWINKRRSKRSDRLSMRWLNDNETCRIRPRSLLFPIDHSSSYEDDNEDPDDEGFCLRRHARASCYSPSPHVHGLSIIEELSPINDTPKRSDLPNVPSLKLTRNWFPLQTSTTTSIPHITLPKTNPHHYKMTATPTSVKNLFHGTGNILSYDSEEFRQLSEKTGSSADKDQRFVPSEDTPGKCFVTNWKSDHFGLPAPFARRIGCYGKIHLVMSLSTYFLTVNVGRAFFFMDPSEPQASSYIRIEIKPSPMCRRKHLRTHSEERCSSRLLEQSFRTRVIPFNNKPEFHESFTFELRRRHFRDRDYLSISVWVTSADTNLRKRLLGCMAFPLRRLIKKANMMIEGSLNTFDRTVITDGNFFLLRPELGDKQNFPETKINVKTYYDDLGVDNSSHLYRHSPPKIMRRDNWTFSEPPTISSSSESNQFFNGFNYNPSSAKYQVDRQAINKQSLNPEDIAGVYLTTNSNKGVGNIPITMRRNDLNYTTCSSSMTSINRMIPSIITTSDGTSEVSSIDFNNPICNRMQLYVEPIHHPKIKSNKMSIQKKALGLKRAVSLTFSPSTSNSGGTKQTDGDSESRWKFNLSRLVRPFEYLKSKMDFASISNLYPTKNQVLEWKESFESLLSHRYGCLLFRTFLKGEFSDENVDFWIECEEFKKLKEGKKSTVQKAYAIFNEYVAEQSPKEVNLDSDTRAATKAALENGAKSNIFTLAQGRIEQLMAKDSYRRFLKSRLFLDLLKEDDNKVTEDRHRAVSLCNAVDPALKN